MTITRIHAQSINDVFMQSEFEKGVMPNAPTSMPEANDPTSIWYRYYHYSKHLMNPSGYTLGIGVVEYYKHDETENIHHHPLDWVPDIQLMPARIPWFISTWNESPRRTYPRSEEPGVTPIRCMADYRALNPSLRPEIDAFDLPLTEVRPQTYRATLGYLPVPASHPDAVLMVRGMLTVRSAPIHHLLSPYYLFSYEAEFIVEPEAAPRPHEKRSASHQDRSWNVSRPEMAVRDLLMTSNQHLLTFKEGNS